MDGINVGNEDGKLISRNNVDFRNEFDSLLVKLNNSK